MSARCARRAAVERRSRRDHAAHIPSRAMPCCTQKRKVGRELARRGRVGLGTAGVVEPVGVEGELAVGIEADFEELLRALVLPLRPAAAVVPEAALGLLAFEGELDLDRQDHLAALAQLRGCCGSCGSRSRPPRARARRLSPRRSRSRRRRAGPCRAPAAPARSSGRGSPDRRLPGLSTVWAKKSSRSRPETSSATA